MISFRQFQVMFKNSQNQEPKNINRVDLVDRPINTPIELSLHKKLIQKEIDPTQFYTLF